MGKSILYRLFKAGSIPAEARRLLESEGLVVADEGMPGWFITNDVKGPHRRYKKRAEKFVGSLAISRKRVLCYTFRKRQINIASDDPRLGQLHVEVPEPDVLVITFESSDFRPGWQGEIKFKFKTERAREFFDALAAVGAGAGSG